MNKITRLFFFLVTICIVFSCKKDLFEKMSKTTVTGNIKDGNFRNPIQGAKVYIWQYGKTDDLIKSQTFREKLIDSAITDNFGNYTISFKSTNRAHAYKVHFTLNEEFYYPYPNQEIQRGTNNIFDFVAYKACILKATIAYSVHQVLPLNVYTHSEINPSWTLSSFKLNEVKRDTTLILKLIPNKENRLTFNFYEGNTPFFYSEIIKPNASFDTLVRRFDLDPEDFKR